MTLLKSLCFVLLMALCAIGGGPLVAAAESSTSPYPGWRHTGTIWILTTPEGADLPAATVVQQFPLLVRLHGSWFDFTAAQPTGEDLRFATSDGAPLPYQIESWDAARGEAAVWVRVPEIRGQDRQALRIYWGKPDAKSESSGSAVFSASNGYLSVWHMNGPPTDDVGTLTSQDVGTTSTVGMIGAARHFAGKQGVFGGEKIPNYPTDAGSHSTEAWFRAERPNATILAWGNEAGGRGSKVRMLFRSPPHIRIDSNFADVRTSDRLPLGEWIHVAHTYSDGDARIYNNGRLAGTDKPKLNIKSPARLWLGGWFHNYDFVGDLDEVRISNVTRSADWVRLEYENQQPLQRLVGPIVQPGDDLSVSTAQLAIPEGTSTTLTAQAGGAQKLYWVLKRDEQETIVAVDRRTYTFDAGRVSGDASATLQLRAVYPNEVKTRDVAVVIQEKIADPQFVLKSPTVWDGRAPIEVIANLQNVPAATSPGAGELRYRWSVAGPAVVKETAPGKLLLRRAMGSGPLTVTLRLDNGGAIVELSAVIVVNEPQHDAWVPRTPGADERPVDGQFYARNDRGVGTLVYNGTHTEPGDSVFLRVYAGERRIANETQTLGPQKTYAFSVPLPAGLVKYRVEFGSGERVLHQVGNLVCGDAFLIIGQSNAVATDFGKDAESPPLNDWVRTFGSTDGGPQGSRLKLWAPAQARPPGGVSAIGYWGMELGRRLVESQGVPICLINGAVGGTRVDQHQRNFADPTDVATIYGRLLWRVREAGLTHGVRGILWHQGENDQGADGPTGGFGWETYRDYFHELAAAWQHDYPNLQHIHLFQIWPKSCAMGIDGSDNRLREVQRTLPRGFSKMSIMSTLGIRPPGGCHFPAAGYAEFARLLAPLVERDHYGKTFAESITPPNLVRASFASAAKVAVVLEFDQPVVWSDLLASQFYLDGASGSVAGGSVSGNTLTLRLTGPTTATKITYLDSKSWSQDQLLLGTNGIAALTFCEVPIEPR